MRNRLIAIFTSGPFVLALAALLINDHVLKQSYPGLITGKLSDFAGLAVVALPLFAAFPRQARAIYLGLAGAFLWWKSPASGAFIAFMNELLPLSIGRTVDYGDLLALAVLPACAKFAARGVADVPDMARLRRRALPPILAAALFGVMGTSVIPVRKDFTVNSVESASAFPRDEIVEAIVDIMRKRGFKRREPNPPHWEGAFEGNGVFLTYSFPAPNSVAIGLSANPGMFGRGEAREAENIRKSIERSLSLRFKGLEFVDLVSDR
ncbi:MAG TPA: hypothetical protein VIV63_15415 [Steroidobacteraceae bacterium]